MNGTDQELVQVLDGHFHALLLILFHSDRIAPGIRVVTQSREEVTQAPFGGIDARGEAEVFYKVGITFPDQVPQGLGSIPTVGDLPAVEEEDRHGVKGCLASRRGPTQALGQNGAQSGKVDQAQGQLKIG
jgi:hypothetical protein